MISRKDLAALCGVSYQHLNVVMKKPNMPTLTAISDGKEKMYAPEDVHDFLEAFFKDDFGITEDDINLEYEKARLTKYQADREQLKLAVLRGGLCKLEFVASAWEKLLYAFKVGLLAMPSRLSLDLSTLNDPNEVKKLLTNEIDSALNELSSAEYLEALLSDAIAETATEVDS